VLHESLNTASRGGREKTASDPGIAVPAPLSPPPECWRTPSARQRSKADNGCSAGCGAIVPLMHLLAIATPKNAASRGGREDETVGPGIVMDHFSADARRIAQPTTDISPRSPCDATPSWRSDGSGENQTIFALNAVQYAGRSSSTPSATSLAATSRNLRRRGPRFPACSAPPSSFGEPTPPLPGAEFTHI
jgi:hypothetical protein